MIRRQAGSDDAPGTGLNDLDGFVRSITTDDLVGTGLIESFAVGVPLALAVFKDSRCQTAVLEWTRLEMHANQGQQAACLAVAGPENSIVPPGFFPPGSLKWFQSHQRGDEPSFQPFSLLMKRLAGLVDVEILDEESDRPLEEEECHEQA